MTNTLIVAYTCTYSVY